MAYAANPAKHRRLFTPQRLGTATLLIGASIHAPAMAAYQCASTSPCIIDDPDPVTIENGTWDVGGSLSVGHDSTGKLHIGPGWNPITT